MPVRCKREWARVDRKHLINELASAAATEGPPKSLTEQIHLRLLKTAEVRVHPLGHTSKLYRYRLVSGSELALEKRIGEPWLYGRQDVLPQAVGVDSVDVPATKQGRHSNLNAIPSFADQPLRKFRLTSVGDLDAVMARL